MKRQDQPVRGQKRMEMGRKPCGGPSSPPARPTSYRHPLGEDGDSTLSHLLKAQHRSALGAPAVRAHPEEVSCLVGPACCLQDPPVETQQPSPHMYGYPAAPTLHAYLPGRIWALHPYSSAQNPRLPLLPVTTDAPCTPVPPQPVPIPRSPLSPLQLTQGSQSPLPVLPTHSSPSLWPMPIHMSTVTFRLHLALQRPPISPQICICPTWVPDDICEPLYSQKRAPRATGHPTATSSFTWVPPGHPPIHPLLCQKSEPSSAAPAQGGASSALSPNPLFQAGTLTTGPRGPHGAALVLNWVALKPSS